MLYIPVIKTARIALIGELHQEVKDIWLVLHGYGQLVNYFIKHFEPLKNPANLVAAPEGLSRFYTQGATGRVGASWMTKEDRLLEIADQQAYLDQVATHLLAHCPHARLNVLGFSQGVATAWRWAVKSELNIHSLTIWTGQALLNEIDERCLERFAKMKLFHAAASNDEFITLDQFSQQLEELKTHFPHIQGLNFEGKHEINAKILLQLQQQLNSHT